MNERKRRRCEKKGHKWAIRSRRGYEDGHPDFDFFHFRCVGHFVQQERQLCLRCGESSAWETVDDYCINSLGLPAEESSLLRRNNLVWVRF